MDYNHRLPKTIFSERQMRGDRFIPLWAYNESTHSSASAIVQKEAMPAFQIEATQTQVY